VARIHPNRTFGFILGTALISALLLSAGLYHAFIAGCPDGWRAIDIVCIFLPIHGDIVTHLLSYTFVGAILSGTLALLRTWRGQRVKLSSVATDAELLQTSDKELQHLMVHMGLKDKIRLLDCDLHYCFCAGLIRPQIYLSRGMATRLTPMEVEALVLHEKYHMDNRDPLRILIGRLVVSALFFIPALKDIFKRYLVEKEVAADQSAIFYQGHSYGIAGALYKMLREMPLATGRSMAYAGEALEYRIDYLTGDDSQNKPSIPPLNLSITLFIISLLIFTILAPLPTHSP
jgi:beta-lactamase regulating signal transducer with metallopeptidase domain